MSAGSEARHGGGGESPFRAFDVVRNGNGHELSNRRCKQGAFDRRTGFVGGNGDTQNLSALGQAAVLFMIRLNSVWSSEALPDVFQLVQFFGRCMRRCEASHEAEQQDEHETKDFSHGRDHSNVTRRLAKRGYCHDVERYLIQFA